MKGITIGPTGGHGLSRMQGTKVTLAGRTAFLPNDYVPFVMQKLTMGQINAIPKDWFSVALSQVNLLLTPLQVSTVSARALQAAALLLRHLSPV